MNLASEAPPIDDYSVTDHAIWSSLMNGYAERIQVHGCREFMSGFERLGFGHRIEPIATMSDRMQAACGWRSLPVDGLLPDLEFFSLLSKKVFPVAAQMRKPHELGFAELPDLFHDVMGHLPLLLRPIYSDFLQSYAAMAVRHLANPGSLMRLQRFYWYTVETGLIRQDGDTKFVGAAIATSGSECENCMGPAARRQPFSFDAVFSTCYESIKIQRQYFVLDSFASLREHMAELEGALHRFEDHLQTDVQM